MWYSPTETTVCFEILGFAKEWIRSYFEYSTKNTVLAFVDFGAGAGKTNIIAHELGYPLSIAFEADEKLVAITNSNFKQYMKNRKEKGIILTFTGDVTDKKHIQNLKDQVLSIIPQEKKVLLVAYNKNSYGFAALERNIRAFNDVFGSYVYLYQNPVHKKALEKNGLNVHRHIQDPKLRKNRDWLIATRD
jgi:hypothetical protein